MDLLPFLKERQHFDFFCLLSCTPKLFRKGLESKTKEISLRKRAYSNILKISPPKTENFHIKTSDDFFFIFLLKT